MKTNFLYEHLYNKAKIQRRIITPSDFTYRNILPFLDKYIIKKSKILDIGCGVGTLDVYLAIRGHSITAIDISKNAIEVAKRNVAKLAPGFDVNFRVFNFQDDFVTEERYDVILAIEVLEHIKNDKEIVEKIYKLTNPGSLVIASSPLITAPLYKLGLLEKFDKDVGHLRRYSKEEFVQIFRDKGFEILEIKCSEGIIRNFLFTNSIARQVIRFIKGPFSSLVMLMDSVSAKFLGDSDILLVARRR